MTGSISPTLPVIGNPNSSEDPHVRSSLVTLRDAINAVLTSGNFLDGAQIGTGTVPNGALAGNISLNKLTDGTNKQIIVCDISGNPQYVDFSGDGTLTNAGVFRLSATAVYQEASSSGQAVGTSYGNIVSAGTPTAGTYFVVGHANFNIVGSTDVLSMRFSGDSNSRASFALTSILNPVGQTIFGSKTLDGSTALQLQAKCASGGTGVTTGLTSEVAIFGLRIA